MFLSDGALSSVIKKLEEIASGDGKKRKERVSAIRHFLACAELIQLSNQEYVSLAPEEPDRRRLIEAVGHVVSVGGNGEYTPDFTTISTNSDFAVGANFLTTGVRRSRNSTAELPGRPSPLLMLENEVARLHPDHKTNLKADYALEIIKPALALWLVREHRFPENMARAAIVGHVNDALKERYGAGVSGMMLLTSPQFEELMDGVDEILTSVKPDVLGLFTKRTGAPQNGGDAPLPLAAVVGKNIVYYGAPGTGKSHKVDDLAGEINVTRTVFHPDTQNSDFFGCLKPGMNGDKVEYAFSPGPFCRALKAALLDTDHQHFLIIEELNRAPAAAVFGELFQLLDRTGDGKSTYKVDFPNDESKRWMRSDEGPEDEKLFLPSNLTLLATMNSSDQGVFPLDTAFRRRWEQEYVPLYGGNGPQGVVKFIDQSNVHREIKWRSFVECLNDWLTDEFRIAEDRLLGLWFLKETELGGNVPQKILLYLWDDLLRHEDRNKIFAANIVRYGQIDLSPSSGQQIFDRSFLTKLEQNAEVAIVTDETFVTVNGK